MRAHNHHHDVLSLFIAPFDFSCRFGFATNTHSHINTWACNLFLPFLCIVFCFILTSLYRYRYTWSWWYVVCCVHLMHSGIFVANFTLIFRHNTFKYTVHTFHLFLTWWKKHSIKVRTKERSVPNSILDKKACEKNRKLCESYLFYAQSLVLLLLLQRRDGAVCCCHWYRCQPPPKQIHSVL